METNESYVNYKQAEGLYELGFHWLCDYHYSNANREGKFELVRNDRPYGTYYRTCYAAPTLAVAAKWFREMLRYYLSVYPEYDIDRDIVLYRYEIAFVDDYMVNLPTDGKYYETYDEALSSAVSNVVELCLVEKRDNPKDFEQRLFRGMDRYMAYREKTR